MSLRLHSARMLLRIQGGKGNKDRYVPLPPRALMLLQNHWRSQRDMIRVLIKRVYRALIARRSTTNAIHRDAPITDIVEKVER